MSYSFNPHAGLIAVAARIEGPKGNADAVLALDTGATNTLISADFLVLLGYDPLQAPQRVPITTPSGIQHGSLLPVSKLTALGQDRLVFAVLALNLPLSAKVDGLLGLDFFRGQKLDIDFRTGLIDLH